MLNQLKSILPKVEFDLTIEMTPALNEQSRRGGLDLCFTAMPVAGEGIVSETLPPLDMVFAGPANIGKRHLAIDELLKLEIMTFQRGSQPVTVGRRLPITLSRSRKHCKSIAGGNMPQLLKSKLRLAKDASPMKRK
jgi:hypothetical protein